MADPIGAEIVVEQDDAPFSTPKRPSRMTTRNVPADEQIDRPTETRKSSGSGSSSDGRAMLQKALDLLAESRRETKRLQEALKEQMEMTRELKEAVAKQEETVYEMGKQMVEIKEQMTEELQRVREQLETIATNATDGPQRSYADVTRLTPFLPHNDSRTLAAPPNPTDVLYCTIDVSRLGEDEARLSAGTIRATVENEVRSELDNPTWRCRAVTKDPKNLHRVRITCRDESEHEIVKRVAETKLAPGVRILRDDLYPIRVDNVSRIAVLNERNEVRTEITEMLGRENDTEVAKVAWLSKRDIPKTYGSMVVYLKKRSEARRFINEGFFVAGGESGTTKVFERRDRPKQCYNCQEITSHKAYQCDRPQEQFRNVSHAAAPMSHTAETVGSYIHRSMNSIFRLFQLNVRKQGPVHDSLMNDKDIQDATVLAIQEPQARRIQGRLLTTPMWHRKWVKMVPTTEREGRWVIRSMLWVNKEVEAEQVPIDSPDVTAAVVRLPDRLVFTASVYVPGGDAQALQDICAKLRKAIKEVRQRSGRAVDLVIAGDFNRHDQMWGGDDISVERQGEADPIIDLMNDFMLRSLLRRGTKTWQSGDYDTTIDLVLASEELADTNIKCAIHGTEHGSDHRTIETAFDISVPAPKQEERLLFKNAPWKEINSRIVETLRVRPVGSMVQQKTDRLMSAVLEAVRALTPRAKPSPYAKRWWTHDLTQLRHIYTYWRNRARAVRRAGQNAKGLENTAKAAAKQYHDAIRQRKNNHWKEFLADNDNIWKAAKYMKSGDDAAFGKVPQLVKADGTATTSHKEQAEELLAKFFPPLPDTIEDEGPRQQRAPVTMPDLTLEEVERQLWATKSWKAPGEDGLSAIVWKQVWPSVKHDVLAIFQASLKEGVIPDQWRHARIIPLKKPGKDDYTIAKAWRPISLLATLGKVLESVVAERISHAVETYGLFPTNHFGARKQRSAEQALVLLQEHIFSAWRSGHVVSLVSFDVKGAYNGVCKERLLQRMKARGIPEGLLRWIDAFCSERTATIVINGQSSESRPLPQAGLPQGSPLSPILFLFFNADLVQTQIDKNGGAIAFVDDYTAWVSGPTAQSNRRGIQAIIDKALDWERRSGATFEAEKTAIIHFTRYTGRVDSEPFAIKGERVFPKDQVKILGVIMDSRLHYKQHIARAATKGLGAAMELKRLKGMAPSTTRQLFTAMVAPVVDYASNVWMHACKTVSAYAIHRVQRIGAQAIIGSFTSVATGVAEAEAHIATIQERFWRRASKLWVDIHTLPRTNPVRNLLRGIKAFRRFISPLRRIADICRELPKDTMEVIQPFTLAPWEARLQAILNSQGEEENKIKVLAKAGWAVRIATSSSARNDLVGMGGTIRIPISVARAGKISETFSVTLGTREEHNPYTAELVAIAHCLNHLPEMKYRVIVIVTSNKSAAQAIGNPRQQSGQGHIREIYDAVEKLRGSGNRINIIWLPSNGELKIQKTAKMSARHATEPYMTPQRGMTKAKTTILNRTRADLRTERKLPDGVGMHSRKVDSALPGKHTRLLYDQLSWKEASVLAQLRTGMARLNGYLYQIRAAPTDECPCRRAKETVEHFLFRCVKWTTQRKEMFQCTNEKRGNLPFHLGGKAASDGQEWTPNMDAVRATIRFAIATGRLEQR
ncbi:Retrovirus-related Pol polyprotein from type-1 retrotransposable element R1 [Fusarium oxysporum f. sp. conglutinans]|nr:Retrovirus-related Pol polyprotein from type-1 retrotransposable element R1 [Fusarium oxysporum f. sp. conglutinans]